MFVVMVCQRLYIYTTTASVCAPCGTQCMTECCCGMAVQIENDPECAEIQDILKEMTGGRSVPRVFIGGVFLGGGDETEAAARSGSLQKKLAAVGCTMIM